MRKNKNKSFKKGAAQYAFVVDGETELWYINMLKRNEGIRAKVSPEIPDKKIFRINSIGLKNCPQTIKRYFGLLT